MSKWLDLARSRSSLRADSADIAKNPRPDPIGTNGTNGIGSRVGKSCVEVPVNPDDPETWPPFIRWIESVTRAQFGPEAANRQVAAELFFLRRSGEAGWIILPHGLFETWGDDAP